MINFWLTANDSLLILFPYVKSNILRIHIFSEGVENGIKYVKAIRY